MTSSWQARYQPGEWVCVSALRRWLLVDVEPRHPSVQTLWEAMSGAEAVEDVLDILVAGGVRVAPSFVLLWLGDSPRAVLRGTGCLETSKADETSVRSGAGYSSWYELEPDPAATGLILSGPAAGDGPELPMASGVTVASRVVITLDLATAAAPPTLSGPVTGALADTESPPALEQQAPQVNEAAPSYDHLFGATARPLPPSEVAAAAAPTPTAPAASVSPPAPPNLTEFGATAGWNTVAPPGIAAVWRADESAVKVDVAADGADGLIDVLPWLTDATSMPSPTPLAVPADEPDAALPPAPVAEAPEPGEAEGTVNRAALLASVGSGLPGPTVLAGRCPVGHLTPPHSAACRVCGAAIAAQQPFKIARPPLGVLRLSTGDTVTLDRGVLIGRKPTAPPGVTERPHLVRVNSPEHDVSRQHAEIVVEGWQVYVRDLGSTNGTTVTLPDQSPQRLRENELQLLEHGAVIVLADEIQCVFEITG